MIGAGWRKHNHYEFTVEAGNLFPLEVGGRYHLLVYGIPLDADSDDLFCWKGADSVYGFASWSFDAVDGSVVCHDDVDMAFCIDPERPCFADFNGDGEVDTRDVLAFLNAWSADSLAADMDFSQEIDTRDVIEFLNVWNTDCLG